MTGRPFAIASLVFVMLVWGTSFVVTKAVLVEVPPFLLALLRFILAAGILVALAQAQGGVALLPRPRPLGTLAIMGLTGVTLFIAPYNLGLVYTTASDAALITGSAPALTVALAAFTLGERPGKLGALGIGLSVLGAALIVVSGGREADAPNPLLGNLLVLGSLVSWSAFTILGKRLQHAPQLAVTAYSTVFGALFLVPFAASEIPAGLPSSPSPPAWLGILYLGVFPSALCYLLWNRALGALEAGQAANFLNLIPAIAVATAVLFLGETLAPAQLIGGAMILTGVWLSSRTKVFRGSRFRSRGDGGVSRDAKRPV
jgi:drug/metabolite transporter (DMT)-like permease